LKNIKVLVYVPPTKYGSLCLGASKSYDKLLEKQFLARYIPRSHHFKELFVTRFVHFFSV